jgi:hypothetical protein
LDGAYRLELDSHKDHILWVEGSGSDRVVLDTEPETDWWLRLKVKMLSGLVPSSEL